MASQDDKNPYDDSNKPLWHFGAITRSETDNLLMQKRQGTFLVRDSRTCPGDSVLCVSENSKVSHYIITRKLEQFVIGDQIFSSLPEILNFYRGHYLDTTVLVEPCPKRQLAQPPPQPPAPAPQEKLNERKPAVPPDAPPTNPPAGPVGTPNNAVRYKVKYNFTSEDADDLPAQKGEILTLVHRDEADWWTMRNSRGKEGQFPVPWMEAIPNKPAPEVYRTVTSYGKAIQRRIPSAYDKTQLKFEKGDIVKVVKQHMTGSWEGELLKDGTQGFFPFTFIELLPPEEADSISQGQRASQNGMEGGNSLLN